MLWCLGPANQDSVSLKGTLVYSRPDELATYLRVLAGNEVEKSKNGSLALASERLAA
jgi:hypothetical protein